MKKRDVNLKTSTSLKQTLICLVLMFGFFQKGMTQIVQTAVQENEATTQVEIKLEEEAKTVGNLVEDQGDQLTNLVNPQSDKSSGMSKFNIHLEATTIGLVSSISINLEGKLFSSDSDKIHLYGRAGYGYVVDNPVFCRRQESAGGFLGLTMLTGKGNHHFEVNGGVFLGSFEDYHSESAFFGTTCNGTSNTLPLLNAGYRFQKPEGGLIFRANFGLQGFGIGLGYSF